MQTNILKICEKHRKPKCKNTRKLCGTIFGAVFSSLLIQLSLPISCTCSRCLFFLSFHLFQSKWEFRCCSRSNYGKLWFSCADWKCSHCATSQHRIEQNRTEWNQNQAERELIYLANYSSLLFLICKIWLILCVWRTQCVQLYIPFG